MASLLENLDGGKKEKIHESVVEYFKCNSEGDIRSIVIGCKKGRNAQVKKTDTLQLLGSPLELHYLMSLLNQFESTGYLLARRRTGRRKACHVNPIHSSETQDLIDEKYCKILADEIKKDFGKCYERTTLFEKEIMSNSVPYIDTSSSRQIMRSSSKSQTVRSAIGSFVTEIRVWTNTLKGIREFLRELSYYIISAYIFAKAVF